MQQAVGAVLVVEIVFPAARVLATVVVAQFYLLTEEEGFLGQNFEAYRIFKVFNADFLVLVMVEPVEDLPHVAFFGVKAPVSDYDLEFVEGNVPLVISVQLLESFFDSFELKTNLADDLFLQVAAVSSQRLAH